MVAHDGEALFGRVAAEPVGEIGKPVLMQRAGGEDRGGEREERGERRRAREPMRERVAHPADGAHSGARQRIGPGGSGGICVTGSAGAAPAGA